MAPVRFPEGVLYTGMPDGKGGSRTFVARGSKVTTVSAFAFVERGQ